MTSLAQRFEGYVERLPDAPGCWLWTGALQAASKQSSGGYGVIGGRTRRQVLFAHRVAYELYRGSIPEGLVIDHRCRLRCCVNPWHLEPVTTRENILRGIGASARHAKRTHCPRGHLLDGLTVRACGRRTKKSVRHPARRNTSRSSEKVGYRVEADMIDDLWSGLGDALASVGRMAVEFDYQRGRADLVAVVADGAILAVEAKLSLWREALHQAYRNKCFAHFSYVALPPSVARKALKYEHEFRDREVGILSVAPGRIEVELPASWSEPVEPWLSGRAAQAAEMVGASQAALLPTMQPRPRRVR